MPKDKVFYDGSCRVCSGAVKRYDVEKIDVSSKEFKGNRTEAMTQIHLQLSNGEMLEGVDVLIYLWRSDKRTKWLARLASNMLLKPLFKLGYWIFARIRHLL